MNIRVNPYIYNLNEKRYIERLFILQKPFIFKKTMKNLRYQHLKQLGIQWEPVTQYL